MSVFDEKCDEMAELLRELRHSFVFIYRDISLNMALSRSAIEAENAIVKIDRMLGSIGRAENPKPPFTKV